MHGLYLFHIFSFIDTFVLRLLCYLTWQLAYVLTQTGKLESVNSVPMRP